MHASGNMASEPADAADELQQPQMPQLQQQIRNTTNATTNGTQGANSSVNGEEDALRTPDIPVDAAKVPLCEDSCTSKTESLPYICGMWDCDGCPHCQALTFIIQKNRTCNDSQLLDNKDLCSEMSEELAVALSQEHTQEDGLTADTTATEVNDTTLPQGCIFVSSSQQLVFNEEESGVDCSTNHFCICAAPEGFDMTFNDSDNDYQGMNTVVNDDDDDDVPANLTAAQRQVQPSPNALNAAQKAAEDAAFVSPTIVNPHVVTASGGEKACHAAPESLEVNLTDGTIKLVTVEYNGAAETDYVNMTPPWSCVFRIDDDFKQGKLPGCAAAVRLRKNGECGSGEFHMDQDDNCYCLHTIFPETDDTVAACIARSSGENTTCAYTVADTPPVTN